MPTVQKFRLKSLPWSKPSLAELTASLLPKYARAEPGAHDALSLMRKAGLEPDVWQVQVATTPGDQLVLAHRQFGKSINAGAIAVGDACGGEGRLILLVSRSLRQSGELYKKCKEFYNASRPFPLVKDTEHEMELANGSRIISLPASSDTIVGYSSAYRIILDEAARIPDATYYALRPMMLMSGGSILAISTPFGKRGWFWEAFEGQESGEEALDLATVERLLADLDFPIEEYSEPSPFAAPAVADKERSYTWTRTFVPVTKNPRVSRRFLANERRTIPALWFEQEYLCKFVDLGQTVFSYEDLQAMLSGEVSPLFDQGVTAPAVRPLSLGNGVWSH